MKHVRWKQISDLWWGAIVEQAQGTDKARLKYTKPTQLLYCCSGFSRSYHGPLPGPPMKNPPSNTAINGKVEARGGGKRCGWKQMRREKRLRGGTLLFATSTTYVMAWRPAIDSFGSLDACGLLSVLCMQPQASAPDRHLTHAENCSWFWCAV